jgi:hypothetical protein
MPSDHCGAEADEPARANAGDTFTELLDAAPHSGSFVVRMASSSAASNRSAATSGDGQMKSRLQRARRQLRDLLTGCCQVDLDQAGAVSDYRPAGSGDGCGCSSVGTTSPR